jgi:hypothetical protein
MPKSAEVEMRARQIYTQSCYRNATPELADTNPEIGELRENGCLSQAASELMQSEDSGYKAHIEEEANRLGLLGKDKYLNNLTSYNVRDMSLSNYTKDFYRLLKIPEKELFKGSRKERVKQMPTIVDGYAGIGKTTLVSCMVHAIQRWYGKERCNVVYTKEFPLGVLLSLAFKGFPALGWDAKKPIQVLIFDDATAVKVSPSEQRQFFSVRHLMSRETGLKEGLVYTIFVTHSWWRLDTVFRRSALFSAFLSVPLTDLYARREYAKILTNEGVEALQYLAPKAIREDQYKGKSLCVLPEIPKGHKSNIGYLYWQDLSAEYWILEYLKEDADTQIDLNEHVIRYHPKEEAEKIMSKKEAERLLEEKRRMDAERQKRFYWKRKQKIEEAIKQ